MEHPLIGQGEVRGQGTTRPSQGRFEIEDDMVKPESTTRSEPSEPRERRVKARMQEAADVAHLEFLGSYMSKLFIPFVGSQMRAAGY